MDLHKLTSFMIHQNGPRSDKCCELWRASNSHSVEHILQQNKSMTSPPVHIYAYSVAHLIRIHFWQVFAFSDVCCGPANQLIQYFIGNFLSQSAKAKEYTNIWRNKYRIYPFQDFLGFTQALAFPWDITGCISLLAGAYLIYTMFRLLRSSSRLGRVQPSLNPRPNPNPW